MSSGESHDNTRALARRGRGRGKGRRGVGKHELIENFNQVKNFTPLALSTHTHLHHVILSS